MSRNSGFPNKKSNNRNFKAGGFKAGFRSEGPPSAPEKLWIYGKHSAEAALKNPKRKIYQVMVTRNCWNLFKEILAELVPTNLDAQWATQPARPNRHWHGVYRG